MMPRFLALLWDGIAPVLKNHLWQSTCFLLLAALLALALRRNHARARYWLWLAASVKFLVPFSLLVALGSHINLPHRTAAPAQAGIYVAVDEFSEPFVQGVDAPVAAPLAAPSATGRDMEHVLPRLLAAGWFAGFAIVLCVWAVYWRRVSAAVRHAVPIGEGRELAMLRRLERAAGVTWGMETRLVFPRQTGDAGLTWGTQAGAMEPGIFGIARPVLIWPRGMSARLDDAHLEAILAHEVCHVRWRDNLTAAVHMLVEAIFWFHPLVWWLGARLVEERERACDEEVLRLCNRPEVYAEGILKVCEFCLESPLPCVSGVTGSDLKRRIANVLAAHVSLRMGLGKKVMLAVVALMVIAVPIVLGQAQAARRRMLAAVAAAPKPVRAWAAAHAMIEVEQTLSNGLIADAQADGQALPPKQSLDGAPALKFDVVSIRPAADPDPPARPQFEVATVKPHDQTRVSGLLREVLRNQRTPDEIPMTGPDRVRLQNWTLLDLIAAANGVRATQVSGPAWLSDQGFDIEAKVPDGTPKEQLNAMLQSLLEERFGLKVHRGTKTGPGFALVVGKDGPKLKPAAPPPAAAQELTEEQKAQLQQKMQADMAAQKKQLAAVGPFSTQSWGSITTEELAAQLVRFAGAPVIDQTGLTGEYKVTIETWTNADVPGGTIFDAVEKLGLKLESRKVTVETVVVDQVSKTPTPN
jgi:uncharacterized protein (TIGR03435 family)